MTRRFYYAEPDWVMHDVPVDDGFGFDVTRCAIAEFYDSFGLGELCQRAICDQDVRSATHHGIVLDRSETLAAGGSRCDFRYRSHDADRPDSSGALEDAVVVDAKPDQVWSWLTGLADHYCDWHPDHASAE